MNKVDQEWFDALAGKTNTLNESINQIEGSSVRRVLIARRNSIEQEIINFDSKKFEDFKSKLATKGLLKKESKSMKSSLLDTFLSIADSALGLTATRGIGLVTSVLVIGLTVNFFYFNSQDNNAILYRGDTNITYIIDAKPDQKLNELVTGLNEIQAEFTQEQESFGKKLLKIKSTDKVLTFLEEKQIKPKVNDGYINILVSPPKVQNN
jgi:hypothetical protein